MKSFIIGTVFGALVTFGCFHLTHSSPNQRFVSVPTGWVCVSYVDGIGETAPECRLSSLSGVSLPFPQGTDQENTSVPSSRQ